MILRGGPTKLTARALGGAQRGETRRSIAPIGPNRIWAVWPPGSGSSAPLPVIRTIIRSPSASPHQVRRPTRNLLLAEVVVPSGEHHLVLVVISCCRQSQRDDPAADATLSLAPVLAPKNPLFWTPVGRPSARGWKTDARSDPVQAVRCQQTARRCRWARPSPRVTATSVIGPRPTGLASWNATIVKTTRQPPAAAG
jgi:hypothetical protein